MEYIDLSYDLFMTADGVELAGANNTLVAFSGECYASGRAQIMKTLGFLILLAGWVIVLSALVLLAKEGARGVFVFAGVGVEVTGLVLVIRAHMPQRGLED